MAIKSQADQRRPAKYTDQHGRKYTTAIEIRSGHPCEPLTPTFHAPIRLPPQYITFDPDTPGVLKIEYENCVRDFVEADKEWVRRCHETGVELYKDQFDPAAPFNVAILNKVGARPHLPGLVTPLRSLPLPGAAALPAQACQLGNLWALGLKGPNGETPTMPELLREFFVQAEKVMPVFENTFEDDFEPALVPAPYAAPVAVPAKAEHEVPSFLRSAFASPTR